MARELISMTGDEERGFFQQLASKSIICWLIVLGKIQIISNHFLILWYCVLLPGGATHENTTQGFV